MQIFSSSQIKKNISPKTMVKKNVTVFVSVKKTVKMNELKKKPFSEIDQKKEREGTKEEIHSFNPMGAERW
jgi:hypothetical protein